MLGIRVFKLKKIHEEVERLKHKQDAKNGIMSLNNELKLLSAKLADFEEKAGNSQRLLNKKANSSTLLEEERFRKQMQGTFAAKLETLRQMLNEWEAKEGQIEDGDMLSEVVKSMLQNSHRIDAWMNEKTRLMHLRTTKTKSRHRATPMSDRTSSSIRPSSGSLRSRSSTISSQHGIPHSSKRLSPVPSSDGTQVDNKSSRSSRSTIASHRARPAKSPPRKKSPHRRLGDTSSEHQSTIASHRAKPTKSPPRRLGSTSSEHQKRKALSSSRHNAPLPEKATKRIPSIPPVDVNENGSPVLLPFGNLLADTPTEKENSHF